MLTHCAYCSWSSSFASVFIGANGVTYCLCRTGPPTQMDGTDRPVAPYCVNARLNTRLSPANASSEGVKSTSGLYADR